MPLPPRRTGATIFGRTLETVLSERPARVIIDSSRAIDGAKPPRGRRLPRVRGCRRAYATSSAVLSAIIMLLGVTMVILTLARGGGALALGVVLGTMLAADRRRAPVVCQGRGTMSGGGRGAVGARAALPDAAGPRASGRTGARDHSRPWRARPVRDPAQRARIGALHGAGVVAGDALGLTPLAFFAAGLFFVVTMATYVEGSSLHPGARRRIHFRPLRLRRAVELHRGLGDPARRQIVMAMGAVAIS